MDEANCMKNKDEKESPLAHKSHKMKGGYL